IGKTALATAAAETAARMVETAARTAVTDTTAGPPPTPPPGSAGNSIRVEQVRCDERQSLPYAPLQRFTTGMEVPQATARPRDGELLLQAVCDRIEARATESSGMILVVDDAHWAPPATID